MFDKFLYTSKDIVNFFFGGSRVSLPAEKSNEYNNTQYKYEHGINARKIIRAYELELELVHRHCPTR